MGVGVAVCLFFILVLIALRAQKARKQDIARLEDAEPFEDNDSRLTNVPAPEESDRADSVH